MKGVKMEILLLNGSPRLNGNTHFLLSRLLEGIQATGKEAELIRLADLTITPCSGCGHCERKGFCIIKDDMTGLYEKLAQVRHLVVASPIYFYGVTAQTKAFIDRCQAFWSRKYLLGQVLESSDKRYGYLVSTAATGGGKCFDCARLTLRYTFDALDVEFLDEVVVQGVDSRGDVLVKEEALEAAFDLGRKMGLMS